MSRRRSGLMPLRLDPVIVGRSVLIFTLALAACAGSTVEPLPDETFEHTGGAPLGVTEAREVVFEPFPEAEMRSIEFSGPSGDRVTGILAYPTGDTTEVGVLVIPGLPESASQMLEPLALLSCSGAMALAIDAPYVRRGEMHQPLSFDVTDAAEQIQFLVESRRAIDVLERTGASRIGVHAVSWGTSIGATLVAIDDRVMAAALMVGNGGLVDRFMPEGDPTGPLAQIPEEQVDRWVEAMRPLDANLYLERSRASILFQNGRSDPFVKPATAEKMHAAAPDSAQVNWYDVGHEVTPEMIFDNFMWLAEHLALDAKRVKQCVELMPTSS